MHLFDQRRIGPRLRGRSWPGCYGGLGPPHGLPAARVVDTDDGAPSPRRSPRARPLRLRVQAGRG